MNAPSRLPTVQRSGGRLRPASHVERLFVAHFLNNHQSGGVEKVLQRCYPDDAITRAAVTPTATGNASAVLQESVADYAVTLAPLSAGAKLIPNAIRIDLARNVEVQIPTRVVTAADAGSFVIEGAEIPVIAPSLGNATLAPRKIAAIGVFSNELAARSLPSVESVISTIMREAAALAFDAALFSDDAGDTARPAGLFNGIVPLTASTSTDLPTAMADDLGALAGAVGSAGGGQNLLFVASPHQAVLAGLATGDRFPVLPSAALPAGTIAAIEASALAFGFGFSPRIDTSMQATLVMRDDPTAIGTPGSPPTVGAPGRSIFQTDSVAVRMVLDVAWTRRAPQVAIIHNVAW